MAHQLSSGSLETIMAGGQVENPVMQILGSKRMSGGASSERYRLLISDGRHYNSFAMLATQLNDKVESGELSDFSVVRINRLITSMVSNGGKGQKRVLIILDVTVLTPGNEVGERLGTPAPYEEESGGGAGVVMPSAPARSAAPTQQMFTAVDSDTKATHPIVSLNPYQNHWTIKARCTFKGPVKTWSNARGEGKLFSADFMDESGEIRCTAFKESVDKFHDAIEIGKVYFISNCSLKPANKQFTQIKHDYEMTMGPNTIVAPCLDAVTNIPKVQFDFVPIENIENMEDGAVIDLIGVCSAAGEANTFTAKTSGKEFTKRDLTLVDESKRSIVVTLWNQDAMDFDKSDFPVVAIKNARVKIFNNGKTASLGNSSTVTINPDIQESHRLRGWFENAGQSVEYKSVSTSSFVNRDNIVSSDKWCSLNEMKVKQLGTRDAPDYIVVKATIIYSKNDRALYTACPTPNCNKKIVDLQNGMYRCEKCNREFDTFQHRLLARFNLGDISGNQFVNCFHDQSEQILGMTADELGNLQKSDPGRFESVFSAANFQSMLFKLRVKMETFNDTNQLKVIVMVVQKPMDWKMYNKHLIGEIKRMSGMIKPE